MYEVDFDLIINIKGQTCMNEVPNFNTILNAVFPKGWKGNIEHSSGDIKYHHVEPGVTQHTLELAKNIPENIKEQMKIENIGS